MSGRRRYVTPLPVGFEDFHRQSFINYQLNRAHALGYADPDRLRAGAGEIDSLEDCVPVFEAMSRRAADEGKLRQATSYLRIAEFFTPQLSPDKVHRYRRYRNLFDDAFAESDVVRHRVPYAGATIPAYKMTSLLDRARGTVLFHGGFDSVIEEFFAIWERFASAGFDVIAFEGPGQGGARALGGLTFDHDWEKPVSAVLDHFAIDRGALVGLSMGGYWAIRAAGREPRIERVVSWPPVYDWMERLPGFVRPLTRGLVRWRRFMNWNIRVRMRLAPVLRHAVSQAVYLVDGDEPMDAVDWFLGMNADHLGSDRVTQDVLLLAGENDAFQPPVLARKQAEALVSARSVRLRMFTADEHADSHCQMGNLDLACRVITDWLTDEVPESAG